MPVYNIEQYVARAISSILEQTYQNLELLVIDDCSKDLTLEKITQYKDPRIKLIKNNKNMGISISLNKGIHASKGKYIARMDGDDISLPDRIEKQCNFMEENPQIGILGTGYYVIDENGGRKKAFIYPTENIEIRWKLLTGPVFPHPTAMVRKKVLLKNDILYSENLLTAQDYDLWIRLMNYTEGTNLPIPLLEYHQHSKRVSLLKSVNQERVRLIVSAQALSNLIKHHSVCPQNAALFERVIKGDLHPLSITELKHGSILFFLVLKYFFSHSYNSVVPKLKLKSDLLFNYYIRFEKYIEKNIKVYKENKNQTDLVLLQFWIIGKIFRRILILIKPDQSIYVPSSICFYAIRLMETLAASSHRAMVKR